MLTCQDETTYPSARTLVRNKVAGRLFAKDASLYAFDEGACESAGHFMGWTDLGTRPPFPIAKIQEFADQAIAGGFRHVVLIGEGGSTQAPMTITKYNKPDYNALDFKVLDSISPVRVRATLAAIDIERTLVLVSSKSGTTIEMLSNLDVVLDAFRTYIPEENLGSHFVAITDPGSPLERMAHEHSWRACFLGETSVGGRFSALSVFGLVPAALVGIDLETFVSHAKEAERVCRMNRPANPAIALAAFLYDGYRQGRDKFSLLTPKRGRVFGLWIEQLVAESLGKRGVGILPNIELDALVLAHDHHDRTVISYTTKTDLWDERMNFATALSYIDETIPTRAYRIENVSDLAEHFVMWEYAIAMVGYLMKVCPFDQPDVAAAKTATLVMLDGDEGAEASSASFEDRYIERIDMGKVLINVSDALDLEEKTLACALRTLFASVGPGDYFAIDAFLPFDGEGRREALEGIRHHVADKLCVPSCLEIGPRYLHSTGQLQKGGANNGVLLIVSSDEWGDIPLENLPAPTLGTLAKAQASADFDVLAQRGRRCLLLHLPNNSGTSLRALKDAVCGAIEDILRERAASSQD